jgi:hypothetical protein
MPQPGGCATVFCYRSLRRVFTEKRFGFGNGASIGRHSGSYCP